MENNKPEPKPNWKHINNPVSKNQEYLIIDETTNKLIARVQSEEVSEEECYLNALKISAADELLEACLYIQQALPDITGLFPEEIEKLNKAIEKAKPNKR